MDKEGTLSQELLCSKVSLAKRVFQDDFTGIVRAVDDFRQRFEAQWQQRIKRGQHHQRARVLCKNEMILTLFMG
jgi:hypothetical protein